MKSTTRPHRPAETNKPAAPSLVVPNHPVGLLYTMLRHGKGMSHEEAHRKSFESIHGEPIHGLPSKAA